jgi:MinD superfamily P-loop ATPase
MNTYLLWKTSSITPYLLLNNSLNVYVNSTRLSIFIECFMKLHRTVKCDGAILVTTPQAVAVGDVRRELTFCIKTGLKVIGILENMCGYVCPHCSECTNIFSYGGGESLAEMGKVPFLGRIPIDPKLTKASENGENFITAFKDSVAAQTFIAIVKKYMVPQEESMDVSENQ